MKLKDGVVVSYDDFWYDLALGGYLEPEEYLENEEDIKKVRDAIAVLIDYENALDTRKEEQEEEEQEEIDD